MSATISQENDWPTKVLSLSIARSSFCILSACSKKSAIRTAPGWLTAIPRNSSSLLGSSLLGSEEVAHGHAAADVGVLVPLHRALGERLLRCDDFLEQRVFRRFLRDDRVPQLELVCSMASGVL